MKRTFTFATLLAAVALLAGACSDSDPAADGAFNDADVGFAQDMIPHHRQAVEMAELAADRSTDPEILSLADEIIAAQDPEIAMMTGWLEQWGEDVPDDMSGMSGMDHGGDMSMPGMMSAKQMSDLVDSTGPEFDRLFLEQMIEHHEGALEMAMSQQSDGEFADAIALAREIEQTQKAEITRMRDLLAS
ncbi:hypothetical protein HMPREF0063_12855 [Aeromicrobium marinum DSM 15272]|uniref:DUF305 domain-containing protein n=1 Tax=Aeromicrobium marinum DSM 15272 TaxID=585531 RepID=E2SFP6_9ACTN|nr:DUF305 domain-containing protein [Aeromicrobium marinum]EFQ82013.1 hypothetical protein HMPREF0063_12855 [Aeromicrobium marinum DSM 15272]